MENKIQQLIEEAKKYDVDEKGIQLLLNNNQSYDEKREILSALKNQIPFNIVKFIAKEDFNWLQKREIAYAVYDLMYQYELNDKPVNSKEILDKIKLFAKPEFDGMQMRILRWAIINNGIDLDFVKNNLLNPELSYEELDDIRKNYIRNSKKRKNE
jgi:hypothetical protein